MRRKNRQQHVAAIEHFKEYARDLIDAFKDGVGHPDAPFTMELCIGALWRKADQVLLETYPSEVCGTMRIRVSVDADGLIPGFPEAVSVRCLGSREGSPTVYYAVLRVQNLAEAREILHEYRKRGVEVRDWEFYAR